MVLRTEDVRDPNPEILAYRRKSLDEKIKALTTIGDLRRALSLDDWKEYPGQGRNEQLRLIDEEKRKVVGLKLAEAIHNVVVKGSPLARLAVANLISEMGPDARSLESKNTTGFGRVLTDDVLQLAKDPDWGVRQEALRALGTINADPKKVVPVYRSVLEGDAKPEARRLAAQGLGQLMRVVNQLKKRVGTAHRVFADKLDVLAMTEAVIPPLGMALKDADPLVRTNALHALQETAQGIAYLVGEPFLRRTFPSEGRPLTDEEKAEIVRSYEKVRLEIKDFQELSQLWKKAVPSIIPLLSADDSQLRLAAITTLENIGWARLKIKRNLESVPLISTEKMKTTPIVMDDPLSGFFGTGLEPTGKLLTDADVKIRRVTLDFVESLQDKALPLIPQLTKCLTDEDTFVRWGAARALGNIAPLQSQAAVPNLARLLCDPDLNVRIAAAGTLQIMGPLALPALPALTQALLDGDVDSRVAVMNALLAMPNDQVRNAVPALAELLTNPDFRVRKQATQTLGRLGRTATSALPALRKLLGDEDPIVRAAASDAILSIAAP